MPIKNVKRAGITTATLAVVAGLAGTVPVQAGTLGLSVDQLIEKISAASEAAGAPLSFQELACMENPKPGDATQMIVSCTHSLGDGRLLITNAEPSGPLLDISTQPWEGGSGGSGAAMISWIASAINDAASPSYREAADDLANTATASGNGSATMGNVAFYVIDFDGKLTITAQAQ
ncbi:hypothetical protein [Aquicoccus sp. SU-CL01552]|uniref:hypothetical protein n=1 Tax=Aquicoccus sp. SU-CL01552 TaxID=3127656 RepID=UPI0031042568